MTRVQKERANNVNAVKPFSLEKGKISKYVVFPPPKREKNSLTERHKHPLPTQKAV